MEYSRRLALFVIRDQQGQVLLQLRDEKAPVSPNLWAFFGGSIEAGETPEQAVKREAKEELGIELQDLRFFKKYIFQQDNSLREKFVFLASLKTPFETLKKQLREGKDLGLFPLESINNLKMTDYDKKILTDIFQYDINEG